MVGIFDLMISKKEFLNVISSLHIYIYVRSVLNHENDSRTTTTFPEVLIVETLVKFYQKEFSTSLNNCYSPPNHFKLWQRKLENFKPIWH